MRAWYRINLLNCKRKLTFSSVLNPGRKIQRMISLTDQSRGKVAETSGKDRFFSSASRKCGSKFKSVISEHVSRRSSWVLIVNLHSSECHFTCTNVELSSKIFCGIINDNSTLGHVMTWCRQATGHHLEQCWHRSLSPYVVTMPQCCTIIFLHEAVLPLLYPLHNAALVDILSIPHIAWWIAYRALSGHDG